MSADLHIVATGMVTCVGLDAAASCAAMRARLDGFAETRFMGPDGEWLVGGAVPLPRNWIGTKRQAHLLAGALIDIERSHPGTLAASHYVLCLAEPARPGRPVADAPAFLQLLASILGLSAPPKAEIITHGRPSGFAALDRARRLLREGAPSVVIAGVDSHLTGRAVSSGLAARRLMWSGNMDGFIPGEAAAAVLCRAQAGGLRLAGLGLAREEAQFRNGRDQDGMDLPSRGDGMTQAYKLALTDAGATMGQIGYRISDVSGEKYFFRQTALAMARTLRDYHGFQDIWHPAESLGDVGAAVVPVMLGRALVASQRGYAPGRSVLIEGSGDDGACGAAVLHDYLPAERRGAA